MTQEQDIVERLLSLADCDARAGEPLGKCMREAAQTIAALREECDKQAKLAEAGDYQIEALRAERDEAATALQTQREAVAATMLRNSIATGHGDTLEDLLGELEAHIKECAEKAEARVKELEEALAYDAMMADQLCTTLERREARIKELVDRIVAKDELIEEWKRLHHEQADLIATAIRERDELEAERARLWNENRDIRATIDVEKAVADTAIRERDEARKALEPFAKQADRYDPVEGDDDHPLWGAHTLTIGDVRRARIASSNREGGEE